MDRAEELHLVAGLRSGNQAALAVAYETYRARLFSFILRMVSRRVIAEELTQEVWVRLAVRARSLREDTRLEAWLFTVAHNLCLSYWRTTSVDPTRYGHPDVIPLARATAPSPDASAALRELHSNIERGLSRLPALYREALLLVGVHGLTPAEAAGVCGVSPETLRKRLERARARLAREMNHCGPATVREDKL